MKKRTKRNWNENNLTKVKYQSQKRLNYYIIPLDKELYIWGYNSYKKEGFLPQPQYFNNVINDSTENLEETINKFFKKLYISDSEKLIYKDGSVFDNMISLRQKLDFPYDIDEPLSNQVLCQLEKSISDKDKDTIIKWLKIYGMPFLGNPITTDVGNAYIGNPPFHHGFTNDITTCCIKNACICRLGSFLVALNTIYNTFFRYLIYLHRTDNVNIIDLNILNQSQNKNEKTIPMTLKERDDFEKEINSYDLDYIKSYIKSAFFSISIKNVFDIDTIFDNNKSPKSEPYAETLISLAMHQLMVISSSKKIYTANRCKQCNHLYIPTRRSNNYCVDCSRQAHWNQENLKN